MEILADLEYEERGAGEVIYLVHAGVHSAWFAPMFHAPELDGFRVIRPIRPGYGPNPAPGGRRSIADHAAACGRLLRELGVQRAHWVGQSSSCCIGTQAALDDPGLVASLILFEPAKPSGPVREQYASSYVAPAMMAAAGAATWHGRSTSSCAASAGTATAPSCARGSATVALAEAERESAYFFADELPALREWTFGPAEGAAVQRADTRHAWRRHPAVLRRERGHPVRVGAARADHDHPGSRPPRPVHTPGRGRGGDRRLRPAAHFGPGARPDLSATRSARFAGRELGPEQGSTGRAQLLGRLPPGQAGDVDQPRRPRCRSRSGS